MADDADDGNAAGEEGAAAQDGPVSNGNGSEGAVAGADAVGDKAPVLDEILRVVRYVSGLAEEAKKKRPAGPSRSAFDKLIKTVNAIDRNTGETRKLVEGSVRKDRELDADDLAEELRACRGDFGRWVAGERRNRRRWVALAIAAGFPTALLLGILVEQRFQVIPIHDPSGGWRGHIWEIYGRAIVDCAVEAMQTNETVDCPLKVRRP